MGTNINLVLTLITETSVVIYGLPTCVAMGLSMGYLGSYRELPKELLKG